MLGVCVRLGVRLVGCVRLVRLVLGLVLGLGVGIRVRLVLG